MNTKGRFFQIFLLVSLFFVSGVFVASAQTTKIDSLERQIQQRAKERESLKQEAARIRAELNQVGAERGTLTKELDRIDAERKSLENTINQTQNEIDSLRLKIKKSQETISRYNSDIKTYADTVAALLRGVDHYNNITLVELLASSKSFSDFFSARDAYTHLQDPLLSSTRILQRRKIDLHTSSQQLANEQSKLEQEQTVLGDQHDIVQTKVNEKTEVLSQAKQKESNYQKSLQKTLATIAALDAEIREFESKLKFALNPSSLPQQGTVVFDWPLKKILVTQRFGKTVSSKRLYVSGSHSGVDFRAAVGTPVYAVADGIVKGVGDTDKQCYRASFGKWVFIEHTDIGLSTTYGHLSAWKVTKGQQVKKGDLIAYSGNTGHSTAPHLHLSTYATKGVDGEEGARVTTRPSKACPGSNYTMPLAPTDAYLDALAYLPPTDASYFKHN